MWGNAVHQSLASYNAEWLLEKNGSRSPLDARAARLDTHLRRLLLNGPSECAEIAVNAGLSLWPTPDSLRPAALK